VDGRLYSLEDKDNLSDPSWTPVTDMDGDGAVRVLIDPIATGTQRFYRVRVGIKYSAKLLLLSFVRSARCRDYYKQFGSNYASAPITSNHRKFWAEESQFFRENNSGVSKYADGRRGHCDVRGAEGVRPGSKSSRWIADSESTFAAVRA